MKAKTPLSKKQRTKLVSLMRFILVAPDLVPDEEYAADEVRRILTIPPRPEDRQIREPS